jgi:C1A family cysteine protease
MPLVYDQGNLGSCTAQALGALCQFVDKNLGHPWCRPSRLFIYYNERVLEGTAHYDSGAEIRDGIRSLNKWGYPDEALWPYDIEKFTKKPLVKVYKAAIKNVITQYARVAQDLTQVKARVSEHHPVVFGFSVYSSFMTEEVAKTGNMVMPVANDSMEGGHAVLIVGYDDEKQCFIVRNSWGEEWGDKGYFYMPYKYALNPTLSSDFWTIMFVP